MSIEQHELCLDDKRRVSIPPKIAQEMGFGEFAFLEYDHEYGCIYVFAKSPVRDLGIFRVRLGSIYGSKSRFTVPTEMFDEKCRAFFYGNTVKLVYYPERNYIEIQPRMPERLKQKLNDIKPKGS